MTELVAEKEQTREKTPRTPRPRQLNLRFLFQQSEAGPIIGKGGSNIKSIIEKTGCLLNFYEEYHRNRTLVISGPKEDVVTAVKEVSEILKSTVANNDESTRVSIFWVLARDNAMSLIGKEGANAKNIKEVTSTTLTVMFEKNNNTQPSPELLVRLHGTPENLASAVELCLKEYITNITPNFRSYNYSDSRFSGRRSSSRTAQRPSKYKGPQQFHIESTQTIQLKRELAGAVIGKGGGNINRIRAYSGAKINVKTPEDGEDMSSVVVVGRPGCVARAFEMIEECIQIFLANGARIRATGARNSGRRPTSKAPQSGRDETKVMISEPQ